MSDAIHLDQASSKLARRALRLTLSLAWAGGVTGFFAARSGIVAGAELALITSSVTFSTGALIALAFRRIDFQKVATACTIYFAFNLCAGMVIAICGNGRHLNLFVYLFWLFPLLGLNRLVNEPAVGRLFDKILITSPLFIIGILAARVGAILPTEQKTLLVAACLSYICFGLTLNVVTRYREKYIVERERAESMKGEAEVLESISDCFISLNSRFRLTYLNDAACTEFGVDRKAVLNETLSQAAPRFLSKSIRTALQAASTRTVSTVFEAQNEDRSLWYDLRCFPRKDGMSIYFRNITEAVQSRLKLEKAHNSLREHAELLDKAQDAIFVVDMGARFTYWNKGAERLYGWTAEEVTGRTVDEIFNQDSRRDIGASIAAILAAGEGTEELTQRRRDGSVLIVESRNTVVRGNDGAPRSILAINTDRTSHKSNEARIRRLAFYDVLTGLPNRQLLRDRLSEALATTAGEGASGAIIGALLYIELDDFKTVNDTMGHDLGDALLQQVALRLASCVRSGHIVARTGGDEFVVMLEGLSEDPETARSVAKIAGDKILEAFRIPFIVGTYENRTTVSIGAALFQGASDTVDDLTKRTDLAMYRAKAQGGNSMCFFDPAMQTEVYARAALRTDLSRALQNDEFELHYQPQVDSDGAVTGCEALLRWNHPVRGNVSPSEFIPLAEEAGLIVELGRWVLETACQQLAVWAARPGMEDLTVAVNVSIRQFADPRFVHLVRDTLRASGADPRRLKLEITESLVMAKVDEMIARMEDIKTFGVGFSLDDFGTGYSSLSHLRLLPLDHLKIDRSFVNNVLNDSKDASIARTIIGLGRDLNLSVIAEGVETAGQRDFLLAEGCRSYQGFLYSPALKCAQLEEYVAASAVARMREVGHVGMAEAAFRG
jgi:diguanylate cyclase (GGDEF)-like protein/PAS domain S-box-containing protein